MDHFAQPALMEWQHRSVYEAKQVLCVSPFWQGVLAHKHGIDAHVVPNGVDTARYSSLAQVGDVTLAQRMGIRTQDPVLLCVGGVEERKNTLRLLQAFVQLRATLPGLQLVIAGGASLLDHTAYAQAFDAALQGSEHRQDVVLTVPGLFRLADVLAMPSLCEGFGLVVLEALCSGVPVVVSEIAPFTGYLQPDDASWAHPLDVASIARAVRHALNTHNPERIGATAARLSAQFSWPRSAAIHADLYQHMIQKEPEPCL
jgi:glycosyltransferase-like protein